MSAKTQFYLGPLFSQKSEPFFPVYLSFASAFDKCTVACTGDKNFLAFHRTMGHRGLEGTFKGQLIPPHCKEQGHLQSEQASPSPVHRPCACHFFFFHGLLEPLAQPNARMVERQGKISTKLSKKVHFHPATTYRHSVASRRLDHLMFTGSEIHN